MLHVPLSYHRVVMWFMLLGTVQKAPWVVLWEYSRAVFSFRVSHFFYLSIMGEEANYQYPMLSKKHEVLPELDRMGNVITKAEEAQDIPRALCVQPSSSLLINVTMVKDMDESMLKTESYEVVQYNAEQQEGTQGSDRQRRC